MEWEIVGRPRVDLVGYSKPNMVATRFQARIFPGGLQGDLPDEMCSLVVRGLYGTRITLMTEPGPTWQEHPWRCVRILRGSSFPSKKKTGLPGVRIPDLDQLDPVTSKRASRDFQSSYLALEDPADGMGWTFGRVGQLNGRIRGVRVEH